MAACMVNYDPSCAQKQMDLMEIDMPQCFQNGQPKNFNTNDEEELQEEHACLAHFQSMVSNQCNKQKEEDGGLE
jgi:hypothetical protein